MLPSSLDWVKSLRATDSFQAHLSVYRHWYGTTPLVDLSLCINAAPHPHALATDADTSIISTAI